MTIFSKSFFIILVDKLSSVMVYVRTSLLQRFIPINIGPESITRQEFIMQHVTEFTNELYNPQSEEPRAVIDTYAYT